MKFFLREFISLMLFISTTLGVGQTLPSYVPVNGLKAWYGFSGNADDASGNSLHATVYNVSADSNRFGQAASAYFFHGTITSYIIKTNPTNQMLDGGLGSFTISVWFKTGSTGIRTLVNKRRLSGTSNMEGYSLFIDNGKVKFHLADLNNNNTLVDGTNAFNDNQWHHVVAMRDTATDKVLIYVDTQLEKMLTDASTASVSSTGDFYLGRWYNYNTYGYFGLLDDVGFWQRALSQQEVWDLYHSCSDSILVQPFDHHAYIGQATHFVTSYSDTQAIFQWQSDIGFGFQNLSDAGQYLGAHTADLQVSNVGFINNNQLFRCIITSNSCGDTTQIARLTTVIDGIDDWHLAPVVELFPNPTSGYMNIRTAESSRIEHIDILNSSGQLVAEYSLPGIQETVIKISDFPGLYLIRFRFADGKARNERVVVW
jgi:hypothetical protein